MQPKRLFEGFSDEEREELAGEASRRWDARTVRDSNERWNRYPAREKHRILEEGRTLHADLAAAMPKGAGSPEVQQIVQRWRDHLEYFWRPADEQLLGLADLYNEDPRFRRNYEEIAPGLAGFMREAVRVFVKKRQSKPASSASRRSEGVDRSAVVPPAAWQATASLFCGCR